MISFQIIEAWKVFITDESPAPPKQQGEPLATIGDISFQLAIRPHIRGYIDTFQGLKSGIWIYLYPISHTENHPV
jgi:hypothetical protein